MKNSTKAGVALAAAGIMVTGLAATNALADSAPSNTTSGKTSYLTADAKAPARVFAAVNADGTFARGKGISSVSKLGTGIYDVRFTRNISTCSWLGTVGLPGFSGSTGPAQITITGRAGTNNGLFVTTFNGSGAATDEPFMAVVVCG